MKTMNTKTMLTAAFTALVMSVSTTVVAGEAAKFNLNTEKSAIKWKGEKVTGEHTGNVNLKSGSIETNDGKMTAGSFVIDMTSITCTDLEDPAYNEKLVGHLKSEDFFGVEKNPTAKLVIKKAIHEGKDRYKIIADLTIKGITKEIKFPATVAVSDSELSGKAEIVIDRSEFNIRYGSGSFFDNLGDKTIYDNFTLNVTLSAKK